MTTPAQPPDDVRRTVLMDALRWVQLDLADDRGPEFLELADRALQGGGSAQQLLAALLEVAGVLAEQAGELSGRDAQTVLDSLRDGIRTGSGGRIEQVVIRTDEADIMTAGGRAPLCEGVIIAGDPDADGLTLHLLTEALTPGGAANDRRQMISTGRGWFASRAHLRRAIDDLERFYDELD